MSLKAELTGVIGVTIKLNDPKDIDVCYQGLYPQTVSGILEHIESFIEKDLEKMSQRDLCSQTEIAILMASNLGEYTIDYMKLPEISINIPYSMNFSYDGEKFINEFNEFIEEFKELVWEFPHCHDMNYPKYRLHEKRGVPKSVYAPFNIYSEYIRDNLEEKLRDVKQNAIGIVSVSADNTDVWFDAWPYDDNAWDDYVWTGR